MGNWKQVTEYAIAYQNIDSILRQDKKLKYDKEATQE